MTTISDLWSRTELSTEVWYLLFSIGIRTIFIVLMGWLFATFMRSRSASTSHSIWVVVMCALFVQPFLSGIVPPIAVSKSNWIAVIANIVAYPRNAPIQIPFTLVTHPNHDRQAPGALIPEAILRSGSIGNGEDSTPDEVNDRLQAADREPVKIDQAGFTWSKSSDVLFAASSSGKSGISAAESVLKSPELRNDINIAGQDMLKELDHSIQFAAKNLDSNQKLQTDGSISARNNDIASASVLNGRMSLRSASLTIIVIYIVGVVFMLSRLVVACLRLGRLQQSGHQLDVADLNLVSQCSQSIGIVRIPLVKVCEAEITPLVCGLLKPTILLPASFHRWTIDRRQAVLCHELAHVARRDVLWDRLAYLVVCLYWFHPAVHFATRSMRRSREEATDDYVVVSGLNAFLYARQLLDVVTLRFDYPGISFTTMSANSLEARIRRIISNNVRHLKVNTALVCSLTLLNLFFVTISFKLTSAVAQIPEANTAPTAALQPSIDDRKADRNFDDIRSKLKIGVSFLDLIRTAELNIGDPASPSGTIFGTVRDLNGDTVPNATVVLKGNDVNLRVNRTSSMIERNARDLIARTTTDSLGRYEFEYFQQRGGVTVLAATESGQIGWYNASRSGGNYIALDVTLSSRCDGRVSGQLLTTDGAPVANNVVGIQYIDSHRLLSLNGSAESVCFLNFSSLSPLAMTDENGRFLLDGLPSSSVVMLGGEPNFYGAYARTSDGIELGSRLPFDSSRTPNFPDDFIQDSPVKIKKPRQLTVAGKLTWDDGIPIAKCEITASEPNIISQTDESGEFSILAYEMSKHYFSSAVDFDDPNTELKFSLAPPAGAYFEEKQFVVKVGDIQAGKAINIVRPRGAFIHGQVVVHGEQIGLAGAKIAIMPARTDKNLNQTVFRQEQSLVTDEDGKFSIGGITPGKYRLAATGRLPGFNFRPVPTADQNGGRGTIPRNANPLKFYQDITIFGPNVFKLETFEIERLPPIEFVVKDNLGNPIHGALVQMGDHKTTTGDDGVAQLFPMVVTGGRNTISIFAIRDGIDWYGSAQLINGLIRDVKPLEPAWKVKGHIYLNNRPIEGALVTAADTNSFLFLPDTSIHCVPSFSEITRRPTYTNQFGEYELNVRPGSKNIIVPRIPGISFLIKDAKKELNPPDESGWSKLDLHLVSGTGSIDGQIVDENQRPLAKARIVDISQVDSGGQLMVYDSAQHRKIDSEGRFHLTGFPPGQVKLIVQVDPPRDSGQRSLPPITHIVEVDTRNNILKQPTVLQQFRFLQPQPQRVQPNQRIEVSPVKP